MGGYHRNEEATRRVFPVVEGWFDTGMCCCRATTCQHLQPQG